MTKPAIATGSKSPAPAQPVLPGQDPPPLYARRHQPPRRSTTPRHRQLGLSDEQALSMLGDLWRTRLLTDQMWNLQRQGRLSLVIACYGHEGAQVGAAWAIRAGVDWCVPYYRDLGVALHLGQTPQDFLLQLLGKAADPNSGARQMYGHFGSRRLHIVQGSSCVANQLPHAVGVALASKMRREDAATMAFFGEGASSEGDFHVALNFAGVQHVPVVFVCENNRYAISVPVALQMAVPHVADRAPGYGFEGVVVDGNDVLEVYAVAKDAMEKARSGGGPTLIEALTYRTSAHSTTDDDRRYRSREEVEAWKGHDPVLRFTAYCEERGIAGSSQLEKMKAAIDEELEAALAGADTAPEPDPAELVRHVYAEHAP